MTPDELHDELLALLAARLDATWRMSEFGSYRLVAHDSHMGELFLETSLDEDFGRACLRLIDIEASSPGAALGVRALALIKEFCDAHELPLVVQSAGSELWDRPEYNWLAAVSDPTFGDRWLLYRKAHWPTGAKGVHDWLWSAAPSGHS